MRTAIARILITLALIVQIAAPVGSSVAMVAAATDPLAGLAICTHDGVGEDRSGGVDPAILHHGEACALCQLVNGGGFAPPPLAPVAFAAHDLVQAADWHRAVEAVVAARLLDHIRGRAPPSFS